MHDPDLPWKPQDPLCSHDALTRLAWSDYCEELAAVDPGFAEEYRIYSREMAVCHMGLTVRVQPLLRRITCEYRYPDHAVEHYVLELACPAGDYLQLWRELNGWRYRVERDSLPFSLGMLLDYLEKLPDTAPFLALLRDERLRQLSPVMPLDALVWLTRFIHRDYPAVYLLVTAGFSAAPAADQRAITRDSLARSLGVPALSNGQMAALRKLDLQQGLVEDWLVACQLIGREWPLLCRAVAHARQLDARAVRFLVVVKRHSDALQQCRWLDHALAVRWLASAQDHHPALSLYTPGQHEVQFLVLWFALQVQGEAPHVCQHETALIRRFRRCMALMICSVGFNRRKQARLTKKVLQAIDPALHLQAAAAFDGLLDDIRYNDDIASACMDDNMVLVAGAGEPGHGFSRLTTAGDLRAMAALLHNCAASRVWQGVTGESSFWRYDNPVTGEVALLQLSNDALPQADCIIEFNGMHNAGVSDQARADLRRWLAGQGNHTNRS